LEYEDIFEYFHELEPYLRKINFYEYIIGLQSTTKYSKHILSFPEEKNEKITI